LISFLKDFLKDRQLLVFDHINVSEYAFITCENKYKVNVNVM